MLHMQPLMEIESRREEMSDDNGMIDGADWCNQHQSTPNHDPTQWRRTAMADQDSTLQVPDGFCKCGCGGATRLLAHDALREGLRKGEYRRYVRGHHGRGLPVNPNTLAGLLRANAERSLEALLSPKPTQSTRTSRDRAARGRLSVCEWAWIGHCHGRIDRAHVDQNPFNNAPLNLLSLCRSHHFLLDRGRIDPTNPVMPPFYLDTSGKRRYRR